MFKGLLLLLLLTCSLVLLFTGYCTYDALHRDTHHDLALDAFAGSTGLHVIMQPPLVIPRAHEYHTALRFTLQHPLVHTVHVLAESIAHQAAVYEAVRDVWHHKLRTSNIGKRIAYADAVRYANRYLANTTTIICNADISIDGNGWSRLSPAVLAPYLFGLARHERPDCAWQCDCGRKWHGCHDAFAFVPPLAGGDALLERISFRMGGLWGSENRFMWEVASFNPHLIVANPCHTFRTLHWHCAKQGRYRPTQDERRINGDGRSLEPWPSRW